MLLNRLPNLLTGLCCLFSVLLYGQTFTFQQTYGLQGVAEIAEDILETTDGYLIAGTVTNADNGNGDALLIHLDKTGAVLWKKTYGQFDHDGFDRILQANDGGFIVWGDTRDFNNGRSNAWLVKLDNNGNIQWQKTIVTPGFWNSAIGNIIPMPDGYILSGVKTNPGYSQSFVTRVDNNGETMWSRFTPSTGVFEEFKAFNGLRAQYVADNVLYLTGVANHLGIYRTMDPATGDVLQSTEYQVDSNNVTYNMHRTPDGNHLLTGAVRREPGGGLIGSDGWVQKVNAAGEILWSKIYKVGNYNDIGASRILPDGSCVLAMYHNTNFSGVKSRTALIKITADGEVVWAKEIGSGTQYIYFEQLSQTADGGFIAAGVKIENGATGATQDAIWIKTDSLGVVDGCCVANASVTVQDISPNVFHQPFSSTEYEHTQPFEVATADTAALEVVSFCSNNIPVVNRTIAFCPSQPVTLGDSTYTQSGVVELIIPSTNGGCDTLATYTLELLSQPTFDQTITFCPGTTVTLGDSTYSQPGIVTVALPDSTGMGGCDTIVTYTLEWLLQPTFSQTIIFCPGDTITLGDSPYSQPGIVGVTVPSTTGGCDTLAIYTLEWAVPPIFSQTITFCPGTTVTLGDSTYSQPSVVVLTLPSTTGGCDTLATYTLELLPSPTLSQTITFCPGTTVMLADSIYSQPGVVVLTLPSTTGGCDTLATYTLELLPSPTLSQTISFCPGETVTIGDSTYSQPGIVVLTLPSTTGGCDTLATYTLEYATVNQPSTVHLTCPDPLTVSVAPGATSTVVNYNLPEVVSDCPCPGLTVDQSSGGASGSAFPLGINTVCYHATDACGSETTCCFTVTVTEETTCDEKTNGCVHFELLTVRRDADQNWIYRVRITNTCQSEIIYAYLQLPSGVQAVAPADNSVYTAPGGAAYNVRNPNYSPFYSLRFKPLAVGPSSGQSDIFRYVLPQQVDVDYIHVAVRMASGAYVEAHLNTFYCPVGVEKPSVSANRSNAPSTLGPLAVFPNPAAVGRALSITGDELPEGTFLLQDMMGRTVLESRIVDNQVLADGSSLAAGVYFFKVIAQGQFVGSGKLSLF